MKDREHRPSAFLAFARLFSRNWGLKLLSLALAILIYYTLKPDPAVLPARPDRRSGEDHVVRVIEQVAHPAAAPAGPAAAKTPPVRKDAAPKKPVQKK